MDDQRTLGFCDDDEDGRRLARRSDPNTSRRSIPSQYQRESACAVILDVIGSLQLTANEIAEMCERDPRNTTGKRAETFRKRVNELTHAGHLKMVGTRECSITHKPVTVYRRS